MQTGRVVIVANGEVKEPSYYRRLLKPDDYIICVNGGTGHLFAMGLKPDLVVGDLDSLQEEHRQILEKSGIGLERHPSEKDKTDLELAIDRAIEMNPPEIVLFSILGGKRADHLFANLLLLTLPLKHGIPSRALDESGEAIIIRTKTVIEGSPGDYLSLFPLSPEVKGIVTEGLKFPLRSETLHFSTTRGLSNELLTNRASIGLDDGLLLIIKTFRSQV